jgi:hypothetical protein
MTYSAAVRSGTDRCWFCDTPLPHPVRDAGRTGAGAPRAALPRRRDARERRWAEGVLGRVLRELTRD